MAKSTAIKSKYLNVKELAEKLSVSTSWVRIHVFRKTIPFIKLGGLIRFDPDDIQKFVNGSKSEQVERRKYKVAERS